MVYLLLVRNSKVYFYERRKALWQRLFLLKSARLNVTAVAARARTRAIRTGTAKGAKTIALVVLDLQEVSVTSALKKTATIGISRMTRMLSPKKNR